MPIITRSRRRTHVADHTRDRLADEPIQTLACTLFGNNRSCAMHFGRHACVGLKVAGRFRLLGLQAALLAEAMYSSTASCIAFRSSATVYSVEVHERAKPRTRPTKRPSSSSYSMRAGVAAVLHGVQGVTPIRHQQFAQMSRTWYRFASLSGCGPMRMPLFAGRQVKANSRSSALGDRAPKRHQHRLDISEFDRAGNRVCKDSRQRFFAMLATHDAHDIRKGYQGSCLAKARPGSGRSASAAPRSAGLGASARSAPPLLTCRICLSAVNEVNVAS